MTIPFKRLRNWTDPSSPVAPGFGCMSYALFALPSPNTAADHPSDVHAGSILAARSPDGTLWRLGDVLPDLADLTPEAARFLATGRLSFDDTTLDGAMAADRSAPETPAFTEPGSLFVWTRTGLGLLSRRYALMADMGLLLHVHVDPVSAARLFRSGILAPDRTAMPVADGALHAPTPTFALSARLRAIRGRASDRDLPTYEALNSAHWTLRTISRGFVPAVSADTPGRSPTAVPLSAIITLAAFAGCALSVDVDGQPVSASATELSLTDAWGVPIPERHYMLCHSPAVLECLLLALFSEVRAHSCDRSAHLRVNSGRAVTAPSLVLTYTPAPAASPAALAAELARHTYLSRVASLHGLHLTSDPLPLHGPSSLLCTHTLDWLADPALLPTSDLKSHRYLRDEDEEPRA